MTAPSLSVPTANGRYYSRPSSGLMVPSITNIIGKKDKPGLKYWAAKEAANYAADNLQKLQTLTRDEAYSLVRGAPFANRDDSPSAIGDIVHSMIERYVRQEDAPTHEEITHAHNTVKWMYMHFIKFVDHYKPVFTGTEFTVWSDQYGYAGTADLSFQIANLHVLCDTKTGNRVYPETAMQLAALAKADVILSSDGTEREVPGYDRYAILHLRPRSFSLVPVENIDRAFDCFLALKQVFDWDLQFADKTLGFAPKVN